MKRQLAAWDLVDTLELMLSALRPGIDVLLLDREQPTTLQLELVEAMGTVEPDRTSS